jgi:hypothetical protein
VLVDFLVGAGIKVCNLTDLSIELETSQSILKMHKMN